MMFAIAAQEYYQLSRALFKLAALAYLAKLAAGNGFGSFGVYWPGISVYTSTEAFLCLYFCFEPTAAPCRKIKFHPAL